MEATQLKDFEAWLNKRYRLNSVRGTLNAIGLFINWCETENIQAQKTTYNELLDYVAYCTANGNAKRTINQKIGILKNFFNYLIELREREENPAMELRIKNQMHKVVKDVIKREELEYIYKAYPAKGIAGKRNKSIIGLMVYQGLNTCELQALEVKDLKLQEGKIYIPSTNRSNDRIVKLEAQQIVQLQNYLLQVRPVLVMMNDHTSDKLFLTTGGSLRLSNGFNQMINHIRAINPKIRDIKQIRASVIVNWYKHYNTRQVQYMAGHRYISSTEHYRTDKLESLQEQLEKMHPIQ